MAEKLETILSRGTANTRMRDYYDLYILQHDVSTAYDTGDLQAAFTATCHKRGTQFAQEDGDLILSEVRESPDMGLLWSRYQKKYSYASELRWETVQAAVRALYHEAIGAI